MDLFLLGIAVLITNPGWCTGYLVRSSNHWSYKGSLNPQNWQNLNIANNECGLLQQSPIDIKTNDLKKSHLHVSLINHHSYFSNARLRNLGHNVVLVVNVESASEFPMLMLALESGEAAEYIFHSIHFHYGSSSDNGSEHQIDGQSFPMEMHSIYYSLRYYTFDNATKYSDGIVIVAILYQISEHDNHHLWPIVSQLKAVIKPSSNVIVPAFILQDLVLPDQNCPCLPSGYYVYHGSLTTPPCSQAVTWFVHKQKHTISEQQVTEFRRLTKIKYPETDNKEIYYLADNFRPIQPLNNRNIFEL